MQSIDNALEKLSKSKFRSSFHLKAKDIAYIDEKGMDTVRRHAEDFIEKKLAPAYPENDGKQTPMKNHPVFIAQQEKIVNLLMAWIKKEYNSYKNR